MKNERQIDPSDMSTEERIELIEKVDPVNEKIYLGMALGRLESVMVTLSDLERELDGYGNIKKRLHDAIDKLNGIETAIRAKTFDLDSEI